MAEIETEEINEFVTKKEVTSLEVFATKKLAQLYFDKHSAKYLLNQTFSIPRKILQNIVSEVKSEFENVLTVYGGSALYFVLAPEEGDFGDKPHACESLILENKLEKKMWFQIRPLYCPKDTSINCKTFYFPIVSIEPKECLAFDVDVYLNMPITRRQRKIGRAIDAKGELLVYVWESDPSQHGIYQQRGIFGITCGIFLGPNLPLNFELIMEVNNKTTVIKREHRKRFYEQKDHVKRSFFN